jgi:hypothetical protein
VINLLTFVKVTFLTRGRLQRRISPINLFLQTLTDVSCRPHTMIFFNSGVQLTLQGSAVLDDLQSVENHATEIVICSVYLDYFGLKAKVAVNQESSEENK